MKIFNILITILAVIIVYIIFKNYNSKKIENFTSTCTASLTDWERLSSEPSGRELTDPKWNPLKEELEKATKDIVSFSFKDNLFLDTNNVFDYTIDMNNYITIDKNGSGSVIIYQREHAFNPIYNCIAIKTHICRVYQIPVFLKIFDA